MTSIHSVNLNKLKKFLKHNGFKEIRQRGSHIVFNKTGIERPIIVATHGKEVKFYVCLQIINILKITKEEFLNELRNL